MSDQSDGVGGVKGWREGLCFWFSRSCSRYVTVHVLRVVLAKLHLRGCLDRGSCDGNFLPGTQSRLSIVVEPRLFTVVQVNVGFEMRIGQVPDSHVDADDA